MYKFSVPKENPDDIIVSLAGIPNVGKSTVFNSLTGLKQHTGNWAGKTVATATGKAGKYIFVDLPGTYSLMSRSKKEEIARDFICFGGSDYTIVVCDATSLERNLNLVLQTIEITPNVLVCLNLIDEAEKKGIKINAKKLEELLGVPVATVIARKKLGVTEMLGLLTKPEKTVKIEYDNTLSVHIDEISSEIDKLYVNLNSRWIAVKLLEGDKTIINSINEFIGYNILNIDGVSQAVHHAKDALKNINVSDRIVSTTVRQAESIAAQCIKRKSTESTHCERKIDRFLTGKYTGIPIMLLILGILLWITIVGANYSSDSLSYFFSRLENYLTALAISIGMPKWLYGVLLQGILRIFLWVVLVMLPPIVIFFPLLTLLEDLGYLPRIAFNLDKYFRKACACGKQCLTMR